MDSFFRRRWRAAWTIGVMVFVALISVGMARSARAAGQAPPSTVLDGVYSDAQAKRGEMLYASSCAMCHGDTLVGTSVAPPLVGSDFLADFGGMSVSDLFSKVMKTMPSDDPGTLMPRGAVIADELLGLTAQAA